MDANNLRGDWRDLRYAPRWAFSDRKIALHARGVVIGLVVFALFAGPNPTNWITFLRQLPALFANVPYVIRPGSVEIFRPGLIGTTFVRFAAMFFWLAALWVPTAYDGIAVGRLTYNQLRGDFFAETKEARRTARRRIMSVLGPTLVLALIPLGVIGLAALGGLIGRIPAIGNWWLALGSLALIPGFFAGLLLVLAVLILLAGVALLPALTGVTSERATETSYQLVVIVWSEGWRLLLYELIVWGLAASAGIGFAFVGLRGLFLIAQGVALAAPPYADMLNAAAHHLWRGVPFFESLSGWELTPVQAMPLSMQVGVWTTMAAFLFVTVVLISYVLSVGSVGNVLIYINLRRRIWGDNVLTVEDGKDEDAARPTESVNDAELHHGQDRRIEERPRSEKAAPGR